MAFDDTPFLSCFHYINLHKKDLYIVWRKDIGNSVWNTRPLIDVLNTSLTTKNKNRTLLFIDDLETSHNIVHACMLVGTRTHQT
jgi:hypothetical protein